MTKWKTKWPVKICLIPGSSGDFPINSGEIDPEMKQNDIQGCVIKKAQNIRNGSPHIVGIRNAQLYADFAPFLWEPGSPHHSEPNTHTEDLGRNPARKEAVERSTTGQIKFKRIGKSALFFGSSLLSPTFLRHIFRRKRKMAVRVHSRSLSEHASNRCETN